MQLVDLVADMVADMVADVVVQLDGESQLKRN